MLIVSLRMMQGPLFIYALLEGIKLRKSMLAIELEKGREIVIPDRLGQKHLALSFQYYDAILEILREHISADQKHFIYHRNQIS